MRRASVPRLTRRLRPVGIASSPRSSPESPLQRLDHHPPSHLVGRVEQTLTYADRDVHWGPPKSAAGVREIPAPKFVVDALKRHKIAQGRRRWQIGEAWWSERDLVVDLGDGSPWLPPTFSTCRTRWAKAQGFPKVTFHTLRHGTATLLLAAGVPDAVAVSIMGHADTRILARYQDVIDDLKRDATYKHGALLAADA